MTWRSLAIGVSLSVALFTSATGLAADKFSGGEDRKTAAWILSAQDKLDGEDVSDLAGMKKAIEKNLSLEEANDAFSKLQTCRTVEKYRSNPLPLVAAEHYSFMRYEASKTGDLKFRGLPKKYHDMKIKLIAEGKEERLRTTDWPIAPPSQGTLDWANLGVEHGLADYERREGKKPANGSAADGYESDMNLAASSAFFAWIGRTFGTPYTRTSNDACGVAEPSVD